MCVCWYVDVEAIFNFIDLFIQPSIFRLYQHHYKFIDSLSSRARSQ
jgi:hypothetical protein